MIKRPSFKKIMDKIKDRRGQPHIPIGDPDFVEELIAERMKTNPRFRKMVNKK